MIREGNPPGESKMVTTQPFHRSRKGTGWYFVRLDWQGWKSRLLFNGKGGGEKIVFKPF